MYFNKFNRLKYTINGREYELLDIFSRVAFIYPYISNQVWDSYLVQEGESPEDIARSVYGDTALSWFILMQNNILNDDEWYEGDGKFINLLSEKYSGDAIYITNLPKLQEGDLVVKVTSISGSTVSEIDEDTFRIVKDFDKQFRYVWGVKGSGIFLPNDKIAFARKINNNVEFLSFTDSLTGTSTQYTTVKYVESKNQAPIYFVKVNNRITVPPTVEYDGEILDDYIDQNNISTDPTDTQLNFTNTLLYWYMTHNGSAPSIEKHTFYKDLYNKYYAGQQILIMKTQYAAGVISEIYNALSSNEIGKRIIIETK
jgi:hypothetical protein